MRRISLLRGWAAAHRAAVAIPQGLSIGTKDELTGIITGCVRTERASRVAGAGRACRARGARAARRAVGLAGTASFALWIASLVGHGEHCTAKQLLPHLSHRARWRSFRRGLLIALI